MMSKQQKNNKKNLTTEKKSFFLLKYMPIVYLVVMSVSFFINYNQTFDEKINLNGDNIHYYSLGKALSEGKGYTAVMGLEEAPHTHFLPGYPWFIALLMKCGIDSIHAIKVANGVLLYLSLILLYFILAHFARNRLVAFATVFFTTMHHQLLSYSWIMMSEILFLFLSCVIMLIIIRFPLDKLFIDKGKRLRDILVLCALAGCLAYIYFVRMVGLTVVLAVIAYFGTLAAQKLILLWKNRKEEQEVIKQSKRLFFKYGLVFLLTVVSLLVPKTAWDIRNKMAGKTSSAYSSTYLTKGGGGEKMDTMADWIERINNNGSNYIAKYIPSSVLMYKVDADYYPAKTGKYPSTMEWIVGILFFALLLYGIVKSQNGLLLFFYMGTTFIALLGYQEQYAGYRFMTPIMPFIIFMFFNGVANLVTLIWRLFKKTNPLIPQIVVLFVCSYLMFPRYIEAQTDLRATAKVKTWEKMNDPKMTSYLEACKFFKNLPDSVRVITRKPEIFYMYSGYKKSVSFPWYAEPDSIISYLKRLKASHVIIDDWYAHAYRTLYPAVRDYPEKFKVLKEIGKVDTARKLNPTYILEFNDEWGYHGERIDGKKSGEGYELYQDGRKYVGHFENDKPNGDGTIYDKNGNVAAKGQWRDGLLVKGEGELTYTDGRKYIGQHESNAPDGYGTLYDKDGNIIYKGTWRKGSFLKGEGTLTYQNGNRYTGQIENGQPHGNGTFFDSTGKVTSKGQWRNGVLVEPN